MAAGEAAWMRVLEEGVFRFDASEAARAAAGPSLSFADPRRREAPREGADAPAVVPAFRAEAGGAQEVVLKVRGLGRTPHVYWPSGRWVGLDGGDALG